MGPCIVNILQYISHKMQLLDSLFISGKCSTCFGWYLHPSPGAHITVSTASGICHTGDRWKYHLKHVEQSPDINKLCKVACFLDIYWNIFQFSDSDFFNFSFWFDENSFITVYLLRLGLQFNINIIMFDHFEARRYYSLLLEKCLLLLMLFHSKEIWHSK
jgi:hypothetical protein